MSDLALRLIAENKRTRAAFLDLGNCGLLEVPTEIQELMWLESLVLADEWWEWDGNEWRKRKSRNTGESNNGLIGIAPLAGLTNLRSVILSYTNTTDLSPLARLSALQTLNVRRTGIADLSPLRGLQALQTLNASGTQVGNLSPLTGLTTLQTLNIAGTQVTDFLPLASLRGLQTLDVSGTGFEDVSPLASLSTLQTLDLSDTKIVDLSILAGLPALQTLYLRNVQLTDLSPLANLTALQTVNIRATKVTDISPLASLSVLQSLNVSGTKIVDLSPLANLNALHALNVRGTQVADLSPLASLSGLQLLDVSNTDVVDLSPLANLSALQTLLVSATQVADLSPLANLSALQMLHVRNTEVADLSPLANLSALQTLHISGKHVTGLSPLANLSALQTLNVVETQVADLSPLTSLSALQTLNVSFTHVTDLSPLTSLSALQTLNVSHTPVVDVSPVANLDALQTLNVSHTPVVDVSPVANLDALQTLDVSYTRVTDLSPLRRLISQGRQVQWNSGSWKSPGIYVENCPLINPPAEIVRQGNDSILNYFRERELGDVDHLYEAKMLILGEGGAGKTSLLRRLYQPEQPLPETKDTTKGISIYRHEFLLKNGRTFHLNVWDFGGQEIYHATHQFFLTRRSLYVLLDDTLKDHKSVSDDGFKYWLELIDVFGGYSPVLIFQNEKGGRSKAIDIGGIKGKYDNVKERYAGNLEHPNAVAALRDGIEFFASTLSHIGEELPARWIKVRSEIEARAGEVPYISQQEYFEIYGRHMEFDKIKALHLSRYLHDLGVFLHFQDDPLLSRTVILQNDWATEAVFRILDDETVKAQFGRFNGADCKRIWRDSVYADMHLELLALMQRFELCYLLADSNPQAWLAPQLLPPAKPIDLTDWAKPEDLVLRYRYDFMPKGVISRLTVRLHRFVRNPEMAWITGVLFERDSTMVLVEVLASGGEIELRGRGPEHKSLLSVVAADLDALNDSFHGLRGKVDKLIPCNCGQCRVNTVPEFFEQKYLLQRKQDERLKVECRKSYEDVDVLELLDGIGVDKLSGWAKEETIAADLRTIRIFLASSSELMEDRDKFELYFSRQNDRYRKEGIYLRVVRWENFLDAMSETRLQDEYNKKIRECDIFVSLFFTKTGKFTEEEFDNAYGQFKAEGHPRIYTFFKHAPILTGDITDEINSLLKFKKKLADLGHFYTSYKTIEDLNLQFCGQLDKLLSEDD